MSEILLVFLGSLLSGIGWLVARLIQGGHRNEPINRAIMELDLKAKIEQSDMTSEEAQSFLEGLGISVDALLGQNKEGFANSVAARDTTVGIGLRLRARLDVIEREIDELLTEISLSTFDPAHFEAITKAQKSWTIYQRREALAAYQEMIGGSMRSMVAASTEINLAEQRKAYLADMLRDLKAR